MLGGVCSTCWRWNRGSLLCGRETQTPGCPSERPITSAFRLSSTWTPQKKTPPTAGERCPPGGTRRESSSRAQMYQTKLLKCSCCGTSCWHLCRRTCDDRSYMAKVPSRYARAMRGRLERARNQDFGWIQKETTYWHLKWQKHCKIFTPRSSQLFFPPTLTFYRIPQIRLS